ncbi:MAG: signal recognition particle protein [Opitutales bacterium]|nr:signal recognition particle protein [Opitutales bacterium]
MFENLTDRLGTALRNLRGVGKLSEENMADALREVRTALLSADVHFKVARDFIERVKAAADGQEVLKSVTPGQQIVKIIHDELVALLGEGSKDLLEKKPLRVMLIGLQGSGKTTTAGKMGLLLKKKGYKPMLVACDPYRPAAVDQLETLAKSNALSFYCERDSKDVPRTGRHAMDVAKREGNDLVIFDTAGRLQIDENLIDEIKRLKREVEPHEILLVADAALGQEAVNVARTFHEAVQITGLVLTKMDGDARGGAALSMKSMTGVPIKFVGTGEKVEDFDNFYPERMASRILGMGDVVSLVERAQETIDQKEAERMAEKMANADFTFEDFLSQMQQVKKLGPLQGIVGMLPGMSGVKIGDKEENKMKQTEALILSMTVEERRNPQILNSSRRLRISRGSGMQIKDLNALIKQFQQMRKMMQMMKGTKGLRRMKQMAGMMKEKGMNLPGM